MSHHLDSPIARQAKKYGEDWDKAIKGQK
jgi:hypothetical protein